MSKRKQCEYICFTSNKLFAAYSSFGINTHRQYNKSHFLFSSRHFGVVLLCVLSSKESTTTKISIQINSKVTSWLFLYVDCFHSLIERKNEFSALYNDDYMPCWFWDQPYFLNMNISFVLCHFHFCW